MKAKDLLIALTGTAAAAGAATYYYMWKNLGLPRGAWPVRGFDLERYLGKWYEIARFDFRFEKNLDNTTAEYSMNDDGSIRVVIVATTARGSAGATPSARLSRSRIRMWRD